MNERQAAPMVPPPLNRLPSGVPGLDNILSGGFFRSGVYIIQGACMAADAAPVAVTATNIPTTRPDLFIDVEEGTRWTFSERSGGSAMMRS